MKTFKRTFAKDITFGEGERSITFKKDQEVLTSEIDNNDLTVMIFSHYWISGVSIDAFNIPAKSFTTDAAGGATISK